jgi:2-hydroxychromene-2-carboxylate isomerase
VSAKLDYYLSLNSPWSFLGGLRLHALAKKHDIDVKVMPIDAGQVFPVSGGVPVTKRAPQRQAYRLLELDRWRKFLDVPLILQPDNFPSPESRPAKLVVAATLEGNDALALANAFGDALWVGDAEFSRESVQKAVVAAAGQDYDALANRADSPEVTTLLDSYTAQAIAQQIFGMPSYVFDGELFWGQDRLDFLERAVAEAL